MEDILSQISSKYKGLTPRQQRAAEYLFHNLNEAILLNSRQVAANAGVSEATVIRFVTALGYAGFSEFKRSVGRKILEDSSTTRRLVESEKVLRGRNSVFTDILKGDIENISALGSRISEEVFKKAVDRLCTAGSLYILGLRSSHALAFYLAFDLRFFLSSVKLVELGIGDIPEQLRDIGPKDVLVVISFKRYTRETVKIAEKVKEKGAFIVAITNSELSPIAQLSDIRLITETKIPSYFESYTAAMSLLNALITAIAIREKERAVPVLKHLEKEFEAYQTFAK